MFDLEQAIAEWREQMLAAGVKTPVPLVELESHLRDDIEAKIQSGLTAQKAFDAAALQIGRGHLLEDEFAKNDGLRQLLKSKLVWTATALVLLSSWISFGGSPALALAYGVLLVGLVIASAIDFKHFVIPDQISNGGMVAGLLASCLVPALQKQTGMFLGAMQSLLGIGLGASAMYLISRAGKLAFSRTAGFGTEAVVTREVMGFGSVKLMAAVGAFLGWQGVIFSLIASSLIGSVTGIGLIAVRRREWSSRVPYGPFIALASAIWIFFGKQILEYFQG
jgi:leader peptidase (prepilin peptidase)/N-methyltransferase